MDKLKDKLKTTMAAGAVVLSATGAFADSADNTNPYAYNLEELSNLLNSLPPEFAMNIYNHLKEYTQCIENGRAIDVGTTTMNMLDIMSEYSAGQLKNFVDSPDQFESMPMPDFAGALVCVEQSDAWGLLRGGRLANALCDGTGNLILSFSRPLGRDIGQSAINAAPTCNNL